MLLPGAPYPQPFATWRNVLVLRALVKSARGKSRPHYARRSLRYEHKRPRSEHHASYAFAGHDMCACASVCVGDDLL